VKKESMVENMQITKAKTEDLAEIMEI